MNAPNLPEVEVTQADRDAFQASGLCTCVACEKRALPMLARHRTASATQPLEQQDEGMGVSSLARGPGHSATPEPASGLGPDGRASHGAGHRCAYCYGDARGQCISAGRCVFGHKGKHA